MKSIKYLPIVCALFAASAAADTQWGVGLAAISSNEGYVDVSAETNVVPALFIQTENFQLLGPMISYKLFESGDFKMAFKGQYRFDGYEEDDGDIFKGMEERKGAFDVGFEFGYETGLGDFSFSLLTDATSEHEGYELSASYSKPYRMENGVIAPYISVSNLSEDLVDYYYGVRQNEVSSTRAFYQGDSATNVEIGVNSQWMYSGKHMIVANASYTQFGSAIKDSPLIDESGSFQVILGYVYAF